MSEVRQLGGLRILASERKTAAGSTIRTLLKQQHDPVDPFLVFEEFFFEPGDGFDSRFYTQLEEFIYIIHGEVHHSDDLGNSKTLSTGDAQRIISGKGVHVSEKAGNGLNHGIRIWLNTCKSDREMIPDFSVLKSYDIPRIENKNIIIKTIAGDDSPLKVCGKVCFRDILLGGRAGTTLSIDPGSTSFLYNLSGDNGIVITGDEIIEPGTGYLFNNRRELSIRTMEMPSRMILMTAEPVNEPISISDSISWF